MPWVAWVCMNKYFRAESPYLTVSTSGLVNHFVSKKQEKRRIGAIERKYKAKDISDEYRISNLIMAIQVDYQDLKLSKIAVLKEIEIILSISLGLCYLCENIYSKK